MITLLVNIKYLIQTEDKPLLRINGLGMKDLGVIENAYLIIKDGIISDFGKMSECPEINSDKVLNLNGKSLMPTWIDSHTHLVYAAARDQEFVDRINGLTYAEIAAKGGGILNSANVLNQTSESQLFDDAANRLENLMKLGTGGIEIKSGYSLTVEGELKMLRVIQKLKSTYKQIPIKASFLAAHAYPIAYKSNHDAYIDLIIKEMLPRVADEGLADYMDAFCEEGFFSVDETKRLLDAGWKYGLKPKIHANQLHRSGGVQLGVSQNAVSVDHLESMGIEEIEALKGSNTIPTLLPGAAFFLNMHYQPARMLIDADLPICLASDLNPGTCPSGNMNLLLSIACTQLKMTPNEAIHAQTINGAAALEISKDYGSIAIGKKANFIVLKSIPSVNYIPYAFGENLIDSTIFGSI